MSDLDVELKLERLEFELDVAFTVPSGSVLAILGPNGSGKSTVLGCLAGILAPQGGRVVLGDRVLTGAETTVPAHDRSVGLLSQDPLLFPHMSVVDNVAFAPRSHGMNKSEARSVGKRWLSEVEASWLSERKPGQLSGGQAQRIALARALAGQPRLLLLDEPFAALDVEAAPAIRGLLRRVLRSTEIPRATVLVTHDPLDALVLADHVLVLTDGRIVESGPTKQVLARPRTQFTARIAGLNLVQGIAEADGLRSEDGALISGMLTAEAAIGEPAVAVFAPGEVAVYHGQSEPGGSPRNAVSAVVAALEPHGQLIRMRACSERGTGRWAEGIAADLTPAAVADLALEPGSRIRLVVKASTVSIYPVVSS